VVFVIFVMQLRVHPTMDCSGRSTSNIERDSDLGDDLVRKTI